MNAVACHQQFKHEYIVGVSLLHDLQRSDQVRSHADVGKDRQAYVTPTALPEPPGLPPLEIVGSELAMRTSAQQRSPKNGHPSGLLADKLSRVNQNVLQTPKRLTFANRRKGRDNTSSRVRASPEKLVILSSNSRLAAAAQQPDAKSPVGSHKQTIAKKTPGNSKQTSAGQIRKPPPPAPTPEGGTATVKLPPLAKKPPSSFAKSIPSAYIQQFSRLQTTSAFTNRPVLQPTPILPVYSTYRSTPAFADQRYLPLMRDRVIKANLAQKASLKCKSPPPFRSDSSLSRSTTAVATASQLQAKTSNPLRHTSVNAYLSETERAKLKRTFQQLDHDGDGHLTYPQVQKCLPSNLPRAQETYYRVLYDITTDTTYFGLQEFLTIAVLVDMIAEQDPHIWNTLLDDVDFNYYRDDIIELIDGFDNRCSSITSTITVDTLVALIMNRTTNGKSEQVVNELEHLVPNIKAMKLTRLEFAALVPVFIYVESCLDHGKSLFRFRDHSILDFHMQRALVT